MRPNPIIRLELMRRFRSPLAAWGIPLLVLLPGLAVTIAYASVTRVDELFGNDPMDMMAGDFPMGMPGPDLMVTTAVSDTAGVGMFIAVATALVVGLMIMVPALVGGSVAGERQNQTLQPLQLTAMTPRQIVAGKLVSSIAYLLVAVVCATPALVIPFLMGGLRVREVIGTLGVILLVTVELAAVALAVSAMMRRAAPAIVVSLLTCGTLVLAPPILATILTAFSTGPMDDAPSSVWMVSTVSPVGLLYWVFDDSRSGFEDFGGTTARVLSLVCFAVITVAALWVAVQRVTAPVDVDR